MSNVFSDRTGDAIDVVPGLVFTLVLGIRAGIEAFHGGRSKWIFWGTFINIERA